METSEEDRAHANALAGDTTAVRIGMVTVEPPNPMAPWSDRPQKTVAAVTRHLQSV